MSQKFCSSCGEPVAPDASACANCGAKVKRGLSTGFIVAIVVIGGGCFLCLPLMAAIAIPNLIEARKHGNEAAALGALKTISTSQSLFREADKDGDGVYDYGTLQELNDATLVDGVLGSGTKQGYFFVCQPNPADPEFEWTATATPAVPETTGDRYFATDNTGIIFYRLDQPFQLGPIPTNDPAVRPVGR